MWEEYGDRRIIEQQEAGLKEMDDRVPAPETRRTTFFATKLGHEGDWVDFANTRRTTHISDFRYPGVDSRRDRRPDSKRCCVEISHRADADMYAGAGGQYPGRIEPDLLPSRYCPVCQRHAGRRNAMALFLNLPPKDCRDDARLRTCRTMCFIFATCTSPPASSGWKFPMPALMATGRSDLAS